MDEAGRSGFEGSIPEDVPEGRCGLTIYYEDQPWSPGHVTCWRKSWRDHDRCIWHADVADKPTDEVATARADDWERLDGAVLRGVTLGDVVSFADCWLCGAVLTDATLEEVDFNGAFLPGAALTDATLREVDLSDTFLPSADLTEATLVEPNLADAGLTQADLTGASLGRGHLVGAGLWDADLTDANLVQADLTDALLPGADLTDAFLEGTVFTNAALGGADLTEAHLEDADLIETTLHNANLIDANLRKATLTDADLTGSTLTRTNFQDATLEGATLEEATLKETNLADAELHEARPADSRLLNLHLNPGTDFGERCGYDRDAAELFPAAVESTEPGLIRSIAYHVTDHLPRSLASVAGWPTATLRGYRRWRFLRRVDDEAAEEIADQYDKAQTTYRTYEQLARENALPGKISPQFVRGKDARRKQALAEGDTWTWAWLATQRWITGYGESPWRVVATSLAVILAFGLAYPFVGGIEDAGVHYELANVADVASPTGVSALLRGLYFSIITFTTIGYANVAPIGVGSRLLVGLESFTGAALLALLVAVLARRLTR